MSGTAPLNEPMSKTKKTLAALAGVVALGVAGVIGHYTAGSPNKLYQGTYPGHVNYEPKNVQVDKDITIEQLDGTVIRLTNYTSGDRLWNERAIVPVPEPEKE